MEPPEAGYNFLTILGPTASGKTALAARMASRLNGEVISADSRQVYRGMDIGTGKDYRDYQVDGTAVPVHLTDIAAAGTQYNLFEYQRDFLHVLARLRHRGKFPVLCGGSGLYLQAVLDHYQLVQVPADPRLRRSLEGKPLAELTALLKEYQPRLHNITDIENEKRAIRAIEIARFTRRNPSAATGFPRIRSLNVGILFSVEERRARITERLHRRLEEGMVAEVERLLASGIPPASLLYYGLEYKFITLYLTGELDYQTMVGKLNTAIHQFAKRQMTWFRKMERQGTLIHWISGHLPAAEKENRIQELLGRDS